MRALARFGALRACWRACVRSLRAFVRALLMRVVMSPFARSLARWCAELIDRRVAHICLPFVCVGFNGRAAAHTHKNREQRTCSGPGHTRDEEHTHTHSSRGLVVMRHTKCHTHKLMCLLCHFPIFTTTHDENRTMKMRDGFVPNVLNITHILYSSIHMRVCICCTYV